MTNPDIHPPNMVNKEPATIEEFLKTCIFLEKYDEEKQERFINTIQEEGARREVNRYFMNDKRFQSKKGVYQFCYQKVLNIVIDFFNVCMQQGDHLNAILIYINTQEIYYYSDI